MLYEFEQGYDATETTKNIFIIKGEGGIDYSGVTSLFKKFCLGCMNCNGLIGLKAWILRLHSKTYWQILQVTLRKYQTCSAPSSPV